MKEAKRKYQRECKSKIVTFYKCDKDLLEYANSINFQAFVKQALFNSLMFTELEKEKEERNFH